MSRRFAIFALALATVAASAVISNQGLAQTGRDNDKWIGPPANLPSPNRHRPSRTNNLNFLFEALKIAPDEASAKAIEERIWAIWLTSGSDTCSLLMTRAKAEIDAENLDKAIAFLDAIVELRPDYVEAWNRRATVFYMKKEYGHAISDIGQVLKREPRHFGALAGLGTILQDIGDDKHALEAYRGALAVDPHLEGIADKVKTLTEKVEGEDI
jgi:tetratricopeptide (TPR) repeat protein